MNLQCYKVILVFAVWIIGCGSVVHPAINAELVSSYKSVPVIG
jgi:hypothetical protein